MGHINSTITTTLFIVLYLLSAPLRADPGTFSLLTYNTAGLPSFINGLNHVRHFEIGEKINEYDIALIQEDFLFHLRLIRFNEHAYRSEINEYHDLINLLKQFKLTADGLHRFSNTPFSSVERTQWDKCSGFIDKANDCLAKKGFSVARHQIAEGVEVDIYNLHKDAGSAASDHAARASGLMQLINRIEQSINDGQAVIVAGDWNLDRSSDLNVTLLDEITDATGLIDVSELLGTDEQYINKVDRVLYISSSNLELTPIHYEDLSEEFSDEKGNDLSDHPPILVEFSWQTFK